MAIFTEVTENECIILSGVIYCWSQYFCTWMHRTIVDYDR